MSAKFDFYQQIMGNVGFNYSIVFLLFENMGIHTKIICLWENSKQHFQVTIQQVAMEAILKKEFPSSDILGFVSGCSVSIQVTILKISACYIFPG